MSYVWVGYSLNNLICHKLGVVFSSEKIIVNCFLDNVGEGMFFFFC